MALVVFLEKLTKFDLGPGVYNGELYLVFHCDEDSFTPRGSSSLVSEEKGQRTLTDAAFVTSSVSPFRSTPFAARSNATML
jgi:hypothetical protein